MSFVDIIGAIQKGNAEDLRYLIEQKEVDVNTKINNDITLLHVAVHFSTIECTKILISAGVDVNAKDSKGFTPLHGAAESGQVECAKILISAGADINAKDNNDITPFYRAIFSGQVEIVEVFISTGADVNAKDSKGFVPLLAALKHVEIVKFLISAGADVNAKNNDGYTPLHGATQFGQVEVVEVLISAGADVNAKDYNGFTPLHVAAEYGQIECAKVLISAGADVNTKTNNGSTPLDLAKYKGNTAVVEYLSRISISNVSEKNRENREEQITKQIQKHKEQQAKNIKIAVVFVVFIVVVFFLWNFHGTGETAVPSEEAKKQPEKITFTDSRDGKTYKTIKIGTQTWLTENLNYEAKGSTCYDNKPENCQKFGRLYNWNTAKKICPEGWHLPSDSEWEKLVSNAGTNPGKKLKSNSWSGTDDYGFAALPGGLNAGGKFSGGGSIGLWWSATEHDAGNALRYIMDGSHDNVDKFHNDKARLLSVRCVKD